MGQTRFKTAVSAFALLCAVVCGFAGTAHADEVSVGGGGALLIDPAEPGSEVPYDAYRIADEEGSPIDDSFAWERLAGSAPTGGDRYPAYDPQGPDAARQGKALVRCVSEDLAADRDGSLAHMLAGYVAPGAQPEARVVSGRPAVPVPNGWYLLTSAGRRPLFAWVAGQVVTLGDKSDAPVLVKQVHTGEGWGEGAVGGSGRELRYRIDITVPESIDAYDPYRLVVHDSWDEGLALKKGSVAVELLSGGNATHSKDITNKVEVSVEGDGMAVALPDVHAIGARPGDVVRVAYSMLVAPDARLGAGGLSNTAYATYPRWDGEGETPRDDARAYAVRIQIHKVDEKGGPLAGAAFAVRDAGGTWLAADGTFGDKAARAVFTSDERGLATGIPPLAAGSYRLVELKAPKGYEPASPAEIPFEIDLSIKELTLGVEARAAVPLTVSGVDAGKALVTLELANETSGPGAPDTPNDPGSPENPGDPSDPGKPGNPDDGPSDAEKTGEPGTGGLLDLIPKTGDSAWWIAAAMLAVTGTGLLLAGSTAKRDRKRD